MNAILLTGFLWLLAILTAIEIGALLRVGNWII